MSMPTRYRTGTAIDRACIEECFVPMPTSTVQTHCTLFCFLVPFTVNDGEEGPISETLLYWRSLLGMCGYVTYVWSASQGRIPFKHLRSDVR
jgi:hypothetical protein